MKTYFFTLKCVMILFIGILTNATFGQCTIGQPNISVQAEAFSNITIVEGASTTLTSPIAGAIYQWTLNEIDISGATSSTLTITNFSNTDVGDYNVIVDGVPLANTVALGIFSSSISDYDRDRQALVEFYNSTNGSFWFRNSNWLTDPMETWEGVTVTNCRVTGLRLSNNNLNGPIPASFSNLTALKRINLSKNNISGVLDISTMPDLLDVSVHNNDLSDVVFGSNLLLQRVYIYQNPSFIAGKTIDISTMHQLTDFRASGLSLSGLTTSGTYNNLLYLIIPDNQISGILNISNMPNLRLCNARDNQFTDFNFGSNPELSRLYFYNNPVIPGRTMDISGMRKLLDFRVQGLNLGRLIVSGTYNEMLYFMIQENQISGTLDISNMPNLRQCNARDNQFTDFNFGSNPELSRLYFYNNPVTPGRTMDISGMRKLLDFRVHGLNLGRLIVSGTYNEMFYFMIQENQISGTLDISNMPNLRQCNARDNQFTDFNFGSNSELSRLYFYNNPVTPGRTMDISGMRKLLDFRVQGLGLSQLIMSGTYDEMLYFVIADNQFEGTLDISNMPNITLCNARDNLFDELVLPSNVFGAGRTLNNLNVINNNLHFNDLLPYSSVIGTFNFSYNPQRNVPTLVSGNIVSVNVGGGIDYTWNPSGPNASLFAVPSDGTYSCDVRNSAIPNLVIKSDPVFVSAPSRASVNSSSINKGLGGINSVKIYPNPVQRSMPINADVVLSGDTSIRFVLHTINGQKVKEFTYEGKDGPNTFQLNSEGLSAGQYILTSEFGAKKVSSMIIIQ
ncbi:T9SS type A sorting domain-containing protein [uncultured Aquimarina sp.]|uniref:T9SS type A sorting domain-containing protein n=1 Tax=uncultured Aquimarina sp. TaxID=575652 RepID=UPI002614B4B1|nr:T9SS type A sorting domain-containing protein [uncultured Aquimarina sp.]